MENEIYNYGVEAVRQPHRNSEFSNFVYDTGPNILRTGMGVPNSSNAFYDSYYDWYFPHGMEAKRFQTQDWIPDPKTGARVYGSYEEDKDLISMLSKAYDDYDKAMYNPPVIYGHELSHRNNSLYGKGNITSINDKYFPTEKDKLKAIEDISNWIGDDWYKTTASYKDMSIHDKLDELRARMWAYDMFKPYGSNIYTKDRMEINQDTGKVTKYKEALNPEYIKWFLESSRPEWNPTK